MNNHQSAKTEININTGRLDADLIVVGTGPSGSLAAALAAKAGLSVILLEKENIPRQKPCGGLISNRALSLLPKDFVFPAKLYSLVDQVKVHFLRRCANYEIEKAAGIVADRALFDQHLALYARECGATLIVKHKVVAIKQGAIRGKNIVTAKCFSGKGEINLTSLYLIGAWGAAASVHKNEQDFNLFPKIKGRAILHITPTTDPLQRNEAASFYPLPLLGGMGWQFIGPGFINRGVGGLAGFEQLKTAYGKLFPGTCPPLALKKWVLPFGGPLNRIYSENILLTGDAAGYVDPFSGEGIHNSFLSSHLAVKAVLEAIANDQGAGKIFNRYCNMAFRKTYLTALARPAMLHTLNLLSTTLFVKIISGLMGESTNQNFYS